MRRVVVWIVDLLCIPVGWAIDRIDFSDIGDDE